MQIANFGNMEIRKAKKKDLKEIAGIFREETSKKPYNKKWTEKETLKIIKKFFKENEISVVIIERKIAGFAISYIKPNKKSAFIDELWFRARYQRKGLGKSLMKFLEDNYRKKGINELGLIVNQKAGALQFYNKLGYKKEYAFFQMSKKIK